MPQSVMNFLGGPGLLIILMIAMVAIMILPQRKQQKKAKEMLDNIKEGDRIRTIGGFYARVEQVKDDYFIIELLPDKAKAMIARGAVATVENSEVENEKTDLEKAK